MQCAETHPVEERNVVKQVRVGKGKNSQHLTHPWALSFRESDKDTHFYVNMNDNNSVSEMLCNCKKQGGEDDCSRSEKLISTLLTNTW